MTDWETVADLAERVIRAGRVTVQYEPLPVQARTVAALLYPDVNRATDGGRR